jgi:ElaB/YqjD/DUF883 family membrane-anchored ribosome-binding protein
MDGRAPLAHHPRIETQKDTTMDAAGDKLMQELREVVAAAEELLGATAADGSARMQEMRARAEETLGKARASLEGAGKDVEEQIRAHPFAAVGIAAAVGLVLGVLLARK